MVPQSPCQAKISKDSDAYGRHPRRSDRVLGEISPVSDPRQPGEAPLWMLVDGLVAAVVRRRWVGQRCLTPGGQALDCPISHDKGDGNEIREAPSGR
jgi:hypothetical protein